MKKIIASLMLVVMAGSSAFACVGQKSEVELVNENNEVMATIRIWDSAKDSQGRVVPAGSINQNRSIVILKIESVEYDQYGEVAQVLCQSESGHMCKQIDKVEKKTIRMEYKVMESGQLSEVKYATSNSAVSVGNQTPRYRGMGCGG